MTNLQHTTENLTIHIKVKDYSTWRQAYDGREKSRLAAGITNGRVSATPKTRTILWFCRMSPTWQRRAHGWARMKSRRQCRRAASSAHLTSASLLHPKAYSKQPLVGWRAA